MQHLWMLHDVVVVWPGMLHPGMRTSSIINTQHVETLRSGQTRATCCAQQCLVLICCAEMLRSFGRSVQMLGQQCWDMLCLMICCDRLAGALSDRSPGTVRLSLHVAHQDVSNLRFL